MHFISTLKRDLFQSLVKEAFRSITDAGIRCLLSTWESHVRHSLRTTRYIWASFPCFMIVVHFVGMFVGTVKYFDHFALLCVFGRLLSKITPADKVPRMPTWSLWQTEPQYWMDVTLLPTHSFCSRASFIPWTSAIPEAESHTWSVPEDLSWAGCFEMFSEFSHSLWEN